MMLRQGCTPFPALHFHVYGGDVRQGKVYSPAKAAFLQSNKKTIVSLSVRC